jgi:hypothetical protein
MPSVGEIDAAIAGRLTEAEGHKAITRDQEEALRMAHGKLTDVL